MLHKIFCFAICCFTMQSLYLRFLHWRVPGGVHFGKVVAPQLFHLLINSLSLSAVLKDSHICSLIISLGLQPAPVNQQKWPSKYFLKIYMFCNKLLFWSSFSVPADWNLKDVCRGFIFSRNFIFIQLRYLSSMLYSLNFIMFLTFMPSKFNKTN